MSKAQQLPFVSICTPTFNRRPFWPMAIKCFEEYDYPKDRMEWIIIDDGTDKIEDLVCHIPQVKYFKYDKQMILGKKRNLIHEKTIGDILIYQDDDDYYPPERVSHAVETLRNNPKALCAGSSTIFVYFKHVHKMYRMGPYGPKHASAGTFAFHRRLLTQTKYDDFKAYGEEESFLKGYTIPFVQLDPLKTTLLFSHTQNTFDKRDLIENAPTPTCMIDMNIKLNDFLKQDWMHKFFMKDIDDLLAKYTLGDISHKEEVVNQLQLAKDLRRQKLEERNQIRLETMRREDITTVMAQTTTRINIERIKAITETVKSKKLLARLREYEKRFPGEIQKTVSEQEIDDEVAKQPLPLYIDIARSSFSVIEPHDTSDVSDEVISNIMRFITKNKVEILLCVNGKYVTKTVDNMLVDIVSNDGSDKWLHREWDRQSKLQLDIESTIPDDATENETLVMVQTGCDYASAKRALKSTGDDMIEAVMNIGEYLTS
jgi:glycosyltransferase involved in cell wall biosynthesis